jgi:hypothetical protein
MAKISVATRSAAAGLLVLASLPSALFAQAGGRGGNAAAQAPARVQAVEERTAGMQKIDGYFPLYWDERTGNLFLEIPRFNQEFLFITGLAAGLGSNDIGLDRGQIGHARVVSFQRSGPRIMLMEGNDSFRSSSPNPLERKSVEDSFAKSVLFGFPIAAESNGHVLVDATDFFIRDDHGAGSLLRPGTYRVDRGRSAIYMDRTKAFPKNTEVEVMLTFANDAAAGRGGNGATGPAQGPRPIFPPAAGGGGGRGGGLFSGSVASVSPATEAVTLREHYSLVELPDGNFKPREDDPRAGYGGVTYVDYSVPIGEQVTRHWIRRHRLVKKNPNAAISEPVKPIEYWVDPGAPKDIQQALLDGARWWNQAFEVAGFRNAFKVEVLPPGADPMDSRYNMINWVHRSTRGWSSGGSISDPRTGEIIKATVTLGSLRDRQDYMIFEGLLSPYKTGDEKPDLIYQQALARIRQLSAHEVGHTLGLAHNFYDSSKGSISVMDYPHMNEELKADGTIDISHSYEARIGDWDKVAINYGYHQYEGNTEEPAALTRILDDAWASDIRFLTNQDMDVNPRADWWSNGANQADELNRIMKVRRAALSRIGEQTIRKGIPMAMIEEPLVPVFMYAHFAVEGAASMLGGQDYIYGIRGDGRKPYTWETAANQRKALEAIAATLKPSELVVPKQILDAIPPRPPGFGPHRELFRRTTGDAFDALAPGTAAADVSVGFPLEPARAARLVTQHAIDPTLPGLEEVIDRLLKATFDAASASPYEAEMKRAEERVMVDRVMWLASAAPNSQVRAVASYKLSKLAARLHTDAGPTEAEQAQRSLLAADIKRFLERPAEVQKVIPAADAPPGAPFGDMGMDFLAPVRCDYDLSGPEF